MTNWQSPSVIFSEALAYIKLIHFLGGLYIWEFVLHLDFDLATFMRKRAFRLSFLLYLGARWFPLITVIMQFVLHDSNSKLACGVYVPFLVFFSFGGFLFASSLIVLRVVEIWQHNKIVVGVSTVTWLINLGACIRCVAKIRGHSMESPELCWASNITETKYNMLFISITNLVLLAFILTGLLRWNNRQKGDIWHLLSVQGVPWVVVLTVAAIPPLVLIYLNLNGVTDIMIQIPALIIIAIGAARVYRGPTDCLGPGAHTPSIRVTHGAQLGTLTFVVPRDTSCLSGTGMAQTSGQVYVMDSLTPASDCSSGNLAVEKGEVASGSDEAV